ncbi:hypothetical protein PR202_gb25729 [Eleusine coracana subsp. coracana]|uniref:Protein kinase domain-containing protein n=1 Tax=Eleusine coracana subsp. coracana TaxID=191504 RepID=A0AAV5FPX2_ELECO|nr:hypothetical protein PR202_gb25729 [Eleusine coracana subsp. coracana]
MPGRKQKRFVLCALLYFCSLDLASFTFADDQFIYSGFIQANLSLDGTATITRGGLLELTNGGFNLKGHAFYPTPLSLRMSPSAQYLGLLNDHDNGNTSNNIFAVELDTIQNSEFQDINDNHVGINVNSLQSVEAQNAAFYDETTAIYNLSTVLTDTSYVGFSAATGLINSRYYLLGWSFSIGNTAPRIDITKLPKLQNVGTRSKSSSKILLIVPPVAIVLLIFVCGAIIILARKKLAYSELQEDWEIEFGAHQFSYKDLFRATDGFKNKNMLGVGGFGKVYKGVLPTSKLEIAVKRLSHESKQGMKEFINEIVSIGTTFDTATSCNSLAIAGEKNSPSLDWATRFHIIKGIACGLLYLHEKWDKVVIHRDIKASNVLLDYGLNGRLGDFGLAKSYNRGTDPQTTHMVGTVGYLAPELVRTGRASPLTDVFAFGTLLEVTCGKRPVKHNALGDRFMLVDWVFDHWQKGSIVQTIDERLQGDCNIDEACLVLKLGLLCSQPLVSARPAMHLIIQYLNGDMPLPELTPSDMSFSMLAMIEIGDSIHPPCHTDD